MKKILFTVLTYQLFLGFAFGQGDLDVEGDARVAGTTTTQKIVIQNGATPGYILQSQDAFGSGQWIDPATLPGGGGGMGDDLGNHTATMNLNMSGFRIGNTGEINFTSGASFSDDGAMGLEFSGTQINYSGAQLLRARLLNFGSGATFSDDTAGGLLYDGTQIDYAGAQLLRARQLTFAFGGGDASISEVPVLPSPSPFSESEILIANQSGAPLPVGIGGPVNPPSDQPMASVLSNAGLINQQPQGYLLGVHGNAWALDWFAISDARFKKNINPIQSSLDKVKQIKTVTYQLDKDKFIYDENIDEAQTIGFLAQDLAKIIPEAVKVNANGVYMVRYNTVIPVLVDAIRELDEQVTENAELKNQLTQIQQENSHILERLSQLEAQLVKK